MERESSQVEFQILLDAVESTEVLEKRISLINRLGDLYHLKNCDLEHILQFLTTVWDDSACTEVSHCLLNKTILNVAEKYLHLHESRLYTDFLILGTKASKWCESHIQIIVVSIEGFKDDKHCLLFSQLVLDSLSLSSAAFSALMKSPVIEDKMEMLIIENFVLEQVNLVKASVFEIKKFHSISEELLKLAAVIMNSVVKLCRVYFQAIAQKSCETNGKISDHACNSKEDFSSHVINIIACTIRKLREMGTYAASCGGNLVTLLNLSWKGVVSLLQLVKGNSSDKINVIEILEALLSLATDSLSCVTKEKLSYDDARRVFLLVKFFFINSVRILSDYPCEAIKIYREIVNPVLIVSSLVALLRWEAHLTYASDLLTKIVEPSSFLLPQTLLISVDIKPESKNQILDWLFNLECFNTANLWDNILAGECISRLGSKSFLLGRVILISNLLKASSVFGEEVLIGISTRLDSLLDFLMCEGVYSSILCLQVPISCSSGSETATACQPLFSSVVHALKIFIIVASSSSNIARSEVECFLLRNFIHPHFLCLEIVMELWCFLIAHSERDFVKQIFSELYFLLKLVASSQSSMKPLYPLRKMARSVCGLLCYAEPSSVDEFCLSIVNEDETSVLQIVFTALLMEGFSLDSLSDSMRPLHTRNIVSALNGFLADFQDSEIILSSHLLGLPVLAFSALLPSQIKYSDVAEDINASELIKFNLSLVHGYKNVATGKMKEQGSQLLGATLNIISSGKDVFGLHEIGELLSGLSSLFAEGFSSSDLSYCLLKHSIASFLALLCHMDLPEQEGSPICSSVYNLYYALLRDRHWASAHLALAAFCYFTARTSWEELWRFVPHDAALYFDLDSGTTVKEEMFTLALREFLEKDQALRSIPPCNKEQLQLLEKEGEVLKELYNREATRISSEEVIKSYEDDKKEDKIHAKKRRKIVSRINEGVKILRNGFEFMSGALSEVDVSEVKEAFSSQLSHLQEVIQQFAEFSKM